jgi:hypothetical protein
MISDAEIEQACRRVMDADENRFAVSLCRRGKSGLGYLVGRVVREVPKNELTQDFLDRAFQTFSVLLKDSTE